LTRRWRARPPPPSLKDRTAQHRQVHAMVKDIAFVAYAVRDVPKAAAFYRDVVGLGEGTVYTEQFIEFTVGSGAFAVDGDPPGYEPGTCSGVNFEVDDIAAARQRLVDHGVSVTEVYEFSACSVCFARDPDGNRFALHQLTP
jgi:predicted enzyme related to lactoylglutathione lyase